MRYELYEYYKSGIHDLILNENDLNTVLNLMFVLRDERGRKYIVIDNEARQPFNYHLLGFDIPPTKEEHYKTVFDCKFSKHLAAEGEVDDDFIANFHEIYDRIIQKATAETDRYFERLYNTE